MKPIILFIVAVSLSACHSTPLTTQDQLKSEFSAPADKTLVVLYRPWSFVGSGDKHHIYINGQHIIRLKNGRYATAIVEPGPMIMRSFESRDHREVKKAIAARGGEDPDKVVHETLEEIQPRWNFRSTYDLKAGTVLYVHWSSCCVTGPFKTVDEQEALADIVYLKRGH